MKRKPRLLIADNHRIMADAYTHLLKPEFEVVGVVTDGEVLLESVEEFAPDGVILEVSLPHLNGLDAADLIKKSSSCTKLIFVTGNSDPQVVAEAFRRGASAYVLKQSGAEEFKKAIGSAMDGRSYLSTLLARETVEYLLYRWPQRRLEKAMTTRQTEILRLLVEGNSMKRVADILAITPGTVAFHKYAMMKELNIDSNAELLQYAMKNQKVSSQTRWTIASVRDGAEIEILNRSDEVELIGSFCEV